MITVETVTAGKISVPDKAEDVFIAIKGLCVVLEHGTCPHANTAKDAGTSQPILFYSEDGGADKPGAEQQSFIRAGCGTCEHALADHRRLQQALKDAGMHVDHQPEEPLTPQTVLITAGGRRDNQTAGMMSIMHNPHSANVRLVVDIRKNTKAVQIADESGIAWFNRVFRQE